MIAAQHTHTQNHGPAICWIKERGMIHGLSFKLMSHGHGYDVAALAFRADHDI